MSEYLNPIPHSKSQSIPEDDDKNEQKTPKRIIIKYQTTGVFKDLSKSSQDQSK